MRERNLLFRFYYSYIHPPCNWIAQLF